MSRYFTRPTVKRPLTVATRSLWVSDEFEEPARSGDHIPDVPEHEARDTGLLDANGDTIWEAPHAIGFGRRGEW